MVVDVARRRALQQQMSCKMLLTTSVGGYSGLESCCWDLVQNWNIET